MGLKAWQYEAALGHCNSFSSCSRPEAKLKLSCYRLSWSYGIPSVTMKIGGCSLTFTATENAKIHQLIIKKTHKSSPSSFNIVFGILFMDMFVQRGFENNQSLRDIKKIFKKCLYVQRKNVKCLPLCCSKVRNTRAASWCILHLRDEPFSHCQQIQWKDQTNNVLVCLSMQGVNSYNSEVQIDNFLQNIMSN